jgi:hypothetical protein
MPKYRVLSNRGIEHGAGPGKEKIYFPLGAKVLRTMRSGGHGQLIPTDVSGLIELEPEQAEQLPDWQIPYFEGRPIPASEESSAIEYARLAREKADEQERLTKQEFEEFQAFKKSKAASRNK